MYTCLRFVLVSRETVFFPIGFSLSLFVCVDAVLKRAPRKRVRSSRDDWRPGDARILVRVRLCVFIIYLYTHHRIVFLFACCPFLSVTEKSAIWYETRYRRRRGGRGERRRRCRERRRRQHDQCEQKLQRKVRESEETESKVRERSRAITRTRRNRQAEVRRARLEDVLGVYAENRRFRA